MGDLVGAAPREVRVLSYGPNRGKGHAVRTGMLAARGRYRLFTDVDLHFFEGVPRVAAALAAGAEVVAASRRHPDSRLTLPPRLIAYAVRRAVQSAVFSRLARAVLRLPVRDTQAGLKGFGARAAEGLFPRLTCDGFGFDCELLTLAERAGLAVEEVPVSVAYSDTRSTTTPRKTLRMVRDLFRIRKRLRGAVIDLSRATADVRRAA